MARDSVLRSQKHDNFFFPTMLFQDVVILFATV